MLIDSHRFGSIEIPEDKIITTKRPILGFEHLTTFCLIVRGELAPFLWLQSIERSEVAFLVVNPAVFYPDYRIEINPREIAELEVARLEAVETYAIITVPEDPREISINLQGPVLVNTDNGLAKQLVLVNSDYQVKHRLMDAVEERCTDVAASPEPVEA